MYHQKPLLGELPDFSHPLTPTAAWLFNESSGNKIYDIIGRNHGTFGAGTAAPTWVSEGLYFDGGDHIDLGDNIDSQLSGLTNISFSFLAKRVSDIINAGIIGVGDTASRQLWVYLHNDRIFFSTTTSSTVTMDVLNTFPTDVWCHFVGTYNGSLMKLFKNGVEIGTPAAQTGGLCSGSNNNFIGYIQNYGKINATIKNVMLFDWELNISEIQQLHVNPYCWLAQPFQAEVMYAAPPVGVMSPYYYESLMAGAVI